MHLVIVESPAKAKKLSSYLGKDFQVKASVGHIRDLPKSKLGVDIDNNFQPQYVTVRGKNKVVADLKKAAKQADKIYLAMDPDREGEAIAWHIQTLLEKGKTASDFARSTFHEITKEAVKKAIAKPGKLSMDLVDAQQARRILDRLVGYKVSPVLWRKVRLGLSAGRVQSPALRLIVEREREIEAFKPDEYWEVDVTLGAEKEQLVARVVALDEGKYEPKSEKDVTKVVESLKSAGYEVVEVEKKERRRWSLPPFTTSTLQQAAAHRLGMTSKQTMNLAQHLYEEGLITYHRTDSFSLSSQAIEMARGYIGQTYGNQYVPEKLRVFANKSKNAQEAHEAIRVTDAKLSPEDAMKSDPKFSNRHLQLYDLIRRRFLASQMAMAIYDQTSVQIEADPTKTTGFKKALLRSSGSVLKFDGWMKLFPGGDDQLLADVKTGQKLDFIDVAAEQKFTQPPARYNDATLVKELEKRGIGRPSTYASIISVIENRGYVEREEKRFKPTAIGTTVNDFLVKNFNEIVDYDFTAEMEEDLDRIARGEKEWRQIIKEFYQPFAIKLEEVLEKAERAQIPVEKLNKPCPECGKKEGGELVIRTGRYGKFISCNRFPDCKFTENFQEKVEGVKCPLCHEGDVIIKSTRRGSDFFGCSRYPECDWASWKKPQPGEVVTPEEWAERQAERAKRKKKKTTKTKKKK